MNAMTITTLSAFTLHLFFVTSSAQVREPIQWRFDYEIVNPSRVTVHAKATLAPGWHIYSQFLEEGGPMSTTLTIESNDELHCIGNAQEKGEAKRFYDSLYEMDIVWYANAVSFEQSIQIGHVPIEVKGSVRYMTCNDHLCIPGSCSFSLPIKTLRRAP